MNIDEILTRGVANIIPGKDILRERLTRGDKLNIYLGIDPTATRIHLGHAVPLRKLQAFAEMGHHVTFLIGDFTALIGDTSDKDTERPVLTAEQIQDNFKTYKKQAEKILDFSHVTVRHNSEWLKMLTFDEIIKLCQHFAVGDFVGRELIRRRLDEHKRVGLHEVLYPVMQGYDSYFMDIDLQIGGTDQTFNMQAGRALNKDLRGKESGIMAMGFLEGTDGRKMSKSWGNAIWLEDVPDDMYRKVMAIRDDLIMEYYLLGTNVSMKDVENVKKELEGNGNPMEIKKQLAFEIVSELHSKQEAKDAAENFKKVVQKKELPEEIPTIVIEQEGSMIDFLVTSELVSSRSEAKQLIKQGGVTIDGEQVEETHCLLEDGQVVGVGKRKFVRIKRNI